MKVGLVGSGMIVRDCLEAFKGLDQVSAEAICVRETSKQKGQELAEQFAIPKLYTDYEELLADSEVDIIYIGLPNSLHYEYGKRALQVGRHVILEKPFTTTLQEAEELARYAKGRKLFLFEAITLLYFPNFTHIKEQLPSLGELKLIQCNFSQYSSRYDRYLQGEVTPVFDPEMSGGALLDLNVYNIHLVAALCGKPKEISYTANRGYNGVDTSGVLVLQYDGFVAVCMAAKDSSSPNYGVIQGTKGYLKVNGQVSICKDIEMEIEGNKVSYQKERYTHRMQEEFAQIAEMFEQDDKKQTYERLQETLLVMEILEKARAQI